MAKKKENEVVEGVNKVFEDTPTMRANKCINNMEKQITLSLNRLALIADNMEEFELIHSVDDIIHILSLSTDRIISILDKKMKWNLHSEEVITNDKSYQSTRENQSGEEGKP